MPSKNSFAFCQSRRVGHTWATPENQRWEIADPLRMPGGRLQKRVYCIGRCDRCGSERVEPFAVDRKSYLAEKYPSFYRHSDEFKQRDRLDSGQMYYQAIPKSVLSKL